MAVNTMTFNQLATVLTSIVSQATGRTGLTATNTADFVSVGKLGLESGYDPLTTAISQVLSKTIFSIRPYRAKFGSIEKDPIRWGNHVRKINFADTGFENDDRILLTDGVSVDQQVVKKPAAVQTNFYGASVYFDEQTIFEDQLETAFTGPEQLGSFLSLIMTNLSNRLELSNEGIRRGLVANAIGSVIDENQAGRVVHLLTEYNTATGLSLTATTVYQPDNFAPFMKWVYSRVAQICDLFTEMSTMFQTVITGKPVLRHTPYQDQRIYLYAPTRHDIDARVLADTFHDSYLRYADVETVNYWQSIKSPDQINVLPAYTGADGTVVNGDAVTQGKVFGIIFDRDAMGMTLLDQRVLSTPLNTKGLYRNLHVHAKQRVIMDNTEKIAVLLLD